MYLTTFSHVYRSSCFASFQTRRKISLSFQKLVPQFFSIYQFIYLVSIILSVFIILSGAPWTLSINSINKVSGRDRSVAILNHLFVILFYPPCRRLQFIFVFVIAKTFSRFLSLASARVEVRRQNQKAKSKKSCCGLLPSRSLCYVISCLYSSFRLWK